MEELNSFEKAKFKNKASGITTFKYLNPGELEMLVKTSAICRYEPDEVITRENVLDPYFFAILEGSVKITVQEENGKEVYINTLGAGEVFGEAGFFLNAKRTATVTASTHCVILRLHRRVLSDFLRICPKAGNKMLLVIVFNLLGKLKAANQELAYERKDDMDQAEIDSFISELTGQ